MCQGHSLIFSVKDSKTFEVNMYFSMAFFLNRQHRTVETIYFAHPVLRAHGSLTITHNARGCYGKSRPLKNQSEQAKYLRHKIIINNYSPKWRPVNSENIFYRGVKRRGEYFSLGTDTDANTTFSVCPVSE